MTFTATVTASSGSGTPSGTVTFKDGATTLGTVTLAAGIGNFSTALLNPGSHNITARYNADANFNRSTSQPTTQDVAQFYTIAVSASPSVGGAVDGGGSFAAGSSQTVTATANSGYSFINWTEGGSVVSSSPNYTFTLTSDRNPIANFSSSGTGFYVSAGTGTDTGLCPITAPCATLNYALSVAGAGSTITILDGGVFGPVVITQAVTIVGSKGQSAQIAADPTAQVGCIGALPAGCELMNNGYAVEIAAGPADIVNISDIFFSADLNGIGALKFTSGGQLELTRNIYRGNDTMTGPIVSLYPGNPGTTQAQLYFANSDVGFSSGGAIEIMPSGNTSFSVQLHNVEVHNAQYGLSADAHLLSGPSANVTTITSASRFFSFAGAATTAISSSGAGLVNSTYRGVTMLNSGSSAVISNGPRSNVILTNNKISGNAVGVQTLNGGNVITSVNNVILGNGVDVSGTAPRQFLRR